MNHKETGSMRLALWIFFFTGASIGSALTNAIGVSVPLTIGLILTLSGIIMLISWQTKKEKINHEKK